MTIMPIERGKVREYAVATAAARPAYLDDPKAPVPPTFLATVVFWKPIGETLRSAEVLEACAVAGVPAGLGSLLSLEQEYVYHGPPPRAGETLRTAERLTDVRAKRTRDGRAMVVVRFTVDFHDERGGLRAECNYTSAYVQRDGARAEARAPAPGLRREGATKERTSDEGGGRGLERAEASAGNTAMTELVPGARLPERTFGPVTMTDIVRYQGASGDLNPIHHDDEFARAAGFPAAISVGMLGAGWLAAYCTEHLGEETVRRFRTRFAAVVYRGDRLTASAEVVRLFQQDTESRVELSVRLRKDDGSVVIDGAAEFAVR